MPNIIIETSRPDLISQPANLLARINESLWESGEFGKPEDIKARIFHPQQTLIGLATGTNQAFIYVHFYLMKGRNDTVKQALVECIVRAISLHFKEHETLDTQGKLQICVNPIELSDNYKKVTI